MRHRAVILVGLLTVVVIAGLTRQSGSEPTTVVKVDGSSTVFPITEAVAEEFQKETRGVVRVTVGISGTGGGFKKFCRGETDVQDASRPISQSEMDACRATGIQYYELPIAFDALTIAVSPQATWVDAITIAELKTIWDPASQGRVMTWNQVRNSWNDYARHSLDLYRQVPGTYRGPRDEYGRARRLHGGRKDRPSYDAAGTFRQ